MMLKQKTEQRFFPQQVELAKILQITEFDLQQRIEEELSENPFLNVDENVDKKTDENTYISDVFINKYRKNRGIDESWKENMFSEEESFSQHIETILSTINFSPKEKVIEKYVVFNIDSDGFFDQDPLFVANSLSLTTGEIFTEEDVKAVLQKIQHGQMFGLATKDVCDFLLLQLSVRDDDISLLASTMISGYWGDFLRGHFNKIAKMLNINEKEMKDVCGVIKSMKSYPIDKNILAKHNDSKINPDFFVYVDDSGEVIVKMRFYSNTNLKIENLYKNEIEKNNIDAIFISFAKERIARAQRFIDLLKHRREILLKIMKTIADFQKDFFMCGDIMSLRPMTLKLVSDISRIGLSTVSRVVNSKNVEIPWGVFRLKDLFCYGIKIKEIDRNRNVVMGKIQQIIKNENSQRPLSDEQIMMFLKTDGINISRRTVNKYRKMLKISNSVIRKMR